MLAKELKLTESQRQQIPAIFDRMSAAARPLGARLVEREEVLDRLFVTGKSPLISSRLRPPPSANCKDNYDRCIWQHIWKPARC
jgi:hypothetical protein